MSAKCIMVKAWHVCQRRSFSIPASKDVITPAWKPFESTHGTKLRSLPECQAVLQLVDFLKNPARNSDPAAASGRMADADHYMHTLTSSQHRLALDAALATFSLHVHARMASLVGKGFYTIGPCGEELLSASAMALQPYDSTALHYRHTALSVARQLSQENKSMEEIALARARGYTVSRHDPVTGGVHCSIGGGPHEYVVTSTLSSQCPPAVGRALGYALQQSLGIHPDGMTLDRSTKPVSLVTIGDGSLHNHHFLSAFTLARHAKHLKIKCPLVMGISNNGLSISYETKNYVDTLFGSNDHNQDPLIPVFRANGQDLQSIYDQTQQAMDYARYHSSPCILLFHNIVRRFGHAATDRQAAYLDAPTIQTMAETCVLQRAIQSAVEQWNVTTYAEVLDRLEEIHFATTDGAFAQAMDEPKVTLEDMTAKVVPPLAPLPVEWSMASRTKASKNNNTNTNNKDIHHQDPEKPQVMRKHMTRFYDEEVLGADRSFVYLGEDVRHGGYYLVTEGLAAKYPHQVLDFPPDETTLLGAALGLSQLGFTPIVEIPYAKYLDCGVDMFYEIAIQHWLTTTSTTTTTTTQSTLSPSRSGMIIRLQGFDRGLFGGNFHTHNMLSHIPPGVDVVCYSNGKDYVQGMRYAMHQAKYGQRIVVVVDCTHLLNLRHIDMDRKDRQWEFVYPPPQSILPWDEIRRYNVDDDDDSDKEGQPTTADAAIVTYGNGVVTALQARQELLHQGWIDQASELDIIDCPYLSSVPQGLADVLLDYDKVLFADICKEGPGSNVFSSMITQLQQHKQLPSQWGFCGAPRTYNPLGSTVTFLNCDTIVQAFQDLVPATKGSTTTRNHKREEIE